MENKDKYRSLCEKEAIPLFSQAWWLDAVSPCSWDVCLVEVDNEIVASLPYYHKKKLGFTILTLPKLTQNLGPWIKTINASENARLSHEKKVINQLLDQTPKYHYFKQHLHYRQNNWLPFYWRGFRQTTRYTYIIDCLNDLGFVFSKFEYSKKKDIKKANKIVEITYDISAEEFYANHKYTLGLQGAKISYDFSYFKRIYDAAYARGAGRTIAAYGQSGELHGALFLVWDRLSCYDLISTIDPTFRRFGASSLLIKEAITLAAQHTEKFDFEGSMIEGVERSFRKFGAQQVPYHSIWHIPSRALRLIDSAARIILDR